MGAIWYNGSTGIHPEKEKNMEYKYKAFISYRHIEPDMQAAERLQKLLEAYKPPKSLGAKKENWRIFRDVSELQSSSDLSEIIKNAIGSSEYLIVICSPSYTESKWCLQELTRFREIHGNKNTNIITLLVDGDPRKSFPEELTYTEVTTTNERGEAVTVRVDVEPLAANIVADDLKGSMKKLNTEYLRIAAPLLGCDFNDLFQREKRREAARRRRIFGGVSGILSLISVISIASAVTISGKNRQIQAQNDQILEQNGQILAQNEEIEQKNSDLLVENAGHLAAQSENLYNESRLIPAIQKAMEALPSADEKPVLPEAEYALSRELGSFLHTRLVPELALKHDCAVEQLSFMGAGRSVVSQDATGIYFWDAGTGELLKKLSPSDSEFASEAGSSNELTAYFDKSPDKTGTHFKNTSAPSSVSYENSSVFNKVYTYFAHEVDDSEPGTGGDVYLSNSDSTVWRIDGATGEIKWCAPRSEEAFAYRDLIVDEHYILRLFQNKEELSGGTAIMGEHFFLEIIDRETGKLTDTVDLDELRSGFGMFVDISVRAYRGGVVYIYDDTDSKLKAFEVIDHKLSPKSETEILPPIASALNTFDLVFLHDEPVTASCSLVGMDTATQISRYDGDMAQQKWRVSLPVNYQARGTMFLMPADAAGCEHDVLTVTTDRTVSFVDYEDGSLLKNLPLPDEILEVSFCQNGLVMFVLENGEEYAVSVRNYTTGSDSDNAAYRVQTLSTKQSLCSYSRGAYVTAENYSNTAYLQYPSRNPMYREIDPGEFMYDRDVIAVSDDGATAAVVSTFYPGDTYTGMAALVGHLFLYDTASDTCTEVAGLENKKVLAAAFLGNDKLIAKISEKNADGTYSAEDASVCIDTEDGTVTPIKDAPAATRSYVTLVPTADGVFYLADANRDLVCILPDGTYQSWAGREETVGGREILHDMYAVSGSRAAMYAQTGGEDSRKALLVYDFSAGQQTELACSTDPETDPAVQHIFWQNADTVGVLFSDRTVSLFDAATGEQKASVSLDGTSQEPVSVAAVSTDTFAVLCRDSHLYEMNAEGFTGRSCRLDFANDEENDIYASDSGNAALFEMRPTADGGCIYAVWDKSQAWLLDTARFTVRYRMEHFAAAPAAGDTVFISDTNKNTIGCFPLYSTQELLSAAEEYLAALGES